MKKIEIKVEVVADNFEDLKTKVAELAVSLGMGGFNEEVPSVSGEMAETSEAEGFPEATATENPEPKKEKKTRARKVPAKSEPVEYSAPVEEPKAVAPVSSPAKPTTPAPKGGHARTATLEEAAALLKTVNANLGLEKAREILTGLGCSRMSEVKPEQYGALAEACEKLLA